MSKLLSFSLKVLVASMVSMTTLASQAANQNLNGSDFTLRQNEDVDGSPMLYAEFREGRLVDNKDMVYENLKLNYDALNGCLVSMLENGQMLALDRFLYTRANIDGMEFQNMGVYGLAGFARIIYEGQNLKCYEQTEAYRQTNNRNAYSQVSAKYRISLQNKTMLFLDGSFHEVRRKEKDFYPFFTKTKVKSFLKSNPLDLRKDEDFRKFLIHFDSRP